MAQGRHPRNQRQEEALFKRFETESTTRKSKRFGKPHKKRVLPIYGAATYKEQERRFFQELTALAETGERIFLDTHHVDSRVVYGQGLTDELLLAISLASYPEHRERLNQAIEAYQRTAEFFQEYLGRDNVHLTMGITAELAKRDNKHAGHLSRSRSYHIPRERELRETALLFTQAIKDNCRRTSENYDWNESDPILPQLEKLLIPEICGLKESPSHSDKRLVSLAITSSLLSGGISTIVSNDRDVSDALNGIDRIQGARVIPLLKDYFPGRFSAEVKVAGILPENDGYAQKEFAYLFLNN